MIWIPRLLCSRILRYYQSNRAIWSFVSGPRLPSTTSMPRLEHRPAHFLHTTSPTCPSSRLLRFTLPSFSSVFEKLGLSALFEATFESTKGMPTPQDVAFSKYHHQRLEKLSQRRANPESAVSADLAWVFWQWVWTFGSWTLLLRLMTLKFLASFRRHGTLPRELHQLSSQQYQVGEIAVPSPEQKVMRESRIWKL